MRCARYLVVICTLVLTLTSNAAPDRELRRDLPRDQPSVIKRIARGIKLIIQPLTNYPSPPHP